MDSLFSEIVRLYDEGTPFALGTVVHTSGSTPQKTGARAVFLPGGQLLGTLGGGCMEAEARRRGLALLRGGSAELLELHLDDDFGWDDGLICGGTAQILLQPRPADQEKVFRSTVRLMEERGRGLLVLVAAGPEECIGRMLLLRQGTGGGDFTVTGSLGRQDVEQAATSLAAEVLVEGREEPLRQRIRVGVEQVSLYLEPLLPRPICFIAGAGHVGAALCHYAARAGFEVAIVDDRPSLCNAERLPDATHVLAGDIVETVRNWPPSPDTYYVIVTRGHKHDAVVLRELINVPAAYVGMIGSKRKILTIYDEFLRKGLATPEQLARIHAPIGLDIGALSVEEIALCIAAELVMVRRKGSRASRRAPGPGGEGVASANGAGGERGGDCAGGGREPADGGAEAALAVRQRERAAEGRPLVERLPRRDRVRGGGAPGG